MTGESEVYPRLNRGAARIVFSTNREGNFAIAVRAVDNPDATRLTFNDASDYDPAWSPDGTKIAFNSYRDGQSEVYVMSADGSGQTRLTYDPAYDGMVAWSPDNSKLAFASTRGGSDPRIWVMNADGSGLRQLSAQRYSQHPAWSPDGAQIAFDADGNGDTWQELWLMNADGSNQRQVYDPPESQTDALVRSWSPDGRFVAFTRVTYVLYQGSWYWTSAYLDAWGSPSGNVLRLAADDAAWYPDWQSTDALPPTTYLNQLPAQSPGPIPVSWSGSDAGPAGLQSYDVQARDGASGPWTDWLLRTEGTSGLFPGIGGHTYSFRVRGRDTVGNVEAWPAAAQATTVVENLPPATIMQPLPEFSHYPVIVTWTASDSGGSGVRSYDVQYSIASGSWIDWQTGITTSSTAFTGNSGWTYRLRVRATDNASNTGEWTPDAYNKTTLYTWQIMGAVYDARRRPLPDVSVSGSPATAFPVRSTVSGGYASYFIESQAASIAATKAGYQSPPTLAMPVYPDMRADFLMQPLDNIVINGGFEASTHTPLDWQTAGDLPPMLGTLDKHSGSQAALLGCPEMSSPSTVPSGGYFWAATMRLAAEVGGVVHVVWGETVGSADRLYYARRDGSGAWSPRQNISQDADWAGPPTIAVDGSSSVHVIWQDKASNIRYVMRSPAGGWSAPMPVSGGANGGSPQMIVESGGVVHVAWSGTGNAAVYYTRRSAGGAWSPPLSVSPNTRGGAPKMALSRQGTVHFIWDAPAGGGWTDLFYALLLTDGSVDGPTNLTNTPKNNDAYENLAVDDSGNVYVVWNRDFSGGYQVFYVRRAGSGVWTDPVALSQAGYGQEPQIAADRHGVVHVMVYNDYRQLSPAGVWSAPESLRQAGHGYTIDVQPDLRQEEAQLLVDRDGAAYGVWSQGWDDQAYYRRRGVDGRWDDTYRLAPSSISAVWPQAALAPDGALHAIWSDGTPGGYSIAYSGMVNPPAAGDSILSQTVNVPVSMTNPTLSFLYQLRALSPVQGGWFRVSVDDGRVATTVFSTTEATRQWLLRWTDMSPWVGQTVDVSFSQRQASGQRCTPAVIDEVSLGSWITPVPWTISPNELPVSATVVVTITGQNFLASDPGTPQERAPQVRLGSVQLLDVHWVNSATVTATTPPLAVGPYDLVVTNPSGQAGSLWHAVAVGNRIFLPVLVSGR